MDSFEWNKIVAVSLAGILLVVLLNITSENLFEVHDPEQKAYIVEGFTAPVEDVVEEIIPDLPSLAVLLASSNADQGERIFRRCQACHTINQGGGARLGPNLYNAMGSVVGSKEGYNFSTALAEYGAPWTFELMDVWLASPSAAIPGNRMGFAGLKNAEDRAALLLYMREQSDNLQPLPSE